ncbi:hypothetical protein D3C75_707110 [compost metagenome]
MVHFIVRLILFLLADGCNHTRYGRQQLICVNRLQQVIKTSEVNCLFGVGKFGMTGQKYRFRPGRVLPHPANQRKPMFIGHLNIANQQIYFFIIYNIPGPVCPISRQDLFYPKLLPVAAIENPLYSELFIIYN